MWFVILVIASSCQSDCHFNRLSLTSNHRERLPRFARACSSADSAKPGLISHRPIQRVNLLPVNSPLP